MIEKKQAMKEQVWANNSKGFRQGVQRTYIWQKELGEGLVCYDVGEDDGLCLCSFSFSQDCKAHSGTFFSFFLVAGYT